MKQMVSQDSPKSQVSPVLRFSPTAWAKLLYLRDYGDTEVGGFAIAASDDLLCIEDLRLVKQVGSWAHVAFDDESVADFFDQQVDDGRQPSQFARIWVHTHPGNCPRPSQTDEETFSRVFGHCDWAVMFILARQGESYARLRFNVGPCAAIEIPVSIDYSRPFSGCEFDQWEREYVANVCPEELIRSASAAPEPVLASPFDEEPEEDWLAGWFDYTEDEDQLKGA